MMGFHHNQLCWNYTNPLFFFFGCVFVSCLFLFWPVVCLCICGGACLAVAAGKRVDTYGFYPLNSHFLLFLSLTQTGDRRPLRKGERQRIYSTVGEHSVLPFLYLCAVPDTLLLHIPATLRRRNITVLRNSLVWSLRTAPANVGVWYNLSS